ncbi:MAG: LLM class flavin-dependent oxidoreductase [Alphaproteobacteria bacterium]|nr:LLM class flavin-dependent oxidoreductase [Alphaproteobacteria bacterium]
MNYDIFYSISQTPAGGVFPSEAQMFRNFFDQVEAADALGFGVAWIAESHLSSEVQKTTSKPVIPHWQGEVGLNVDFVQTASRVFARTKRIECGSAIMNILCNGGPVAAAERVAAFLGFHGLDPDERRRLHVGFAAGRFDFMNRAYGIGPRNPLEEAAWPVIKGQVFTRAAEMFCRLLAGEALASDDVARVELTRQHFRDDASWEKVRSLAHTDRIPIEPFFDFERLKIVPAEIRHDLLQLVIGSHDPETQEYVNRFLPVQVFNLSITRPDVIEDTHARMTRAYHRDGGAWERGFMPRTTFVFLNARPGLSPEQQSRAAQEEAREALGAYWTALEGTLDPSKVEKAATNALIGNPAEIAAQMKERFHRDDRLMLWFDFFNHDNDRVIANMADFVEQVAPLVEG